MTLLRETQPPAQGLLPSATSLTHPRLPDKPLVTIANAPLLGRRRITPGTRGVLNIQRLSIGLIGQNFTVPNTH